MQLQQRWLINVRSSLHSRCVLSWLPNNETDYGTGTDDEDFTAVGISYAVSDDLSISLNQSTVDEEGSSEDQEAGAVSFSYTSGGMTISGTHAQMDNVGGTASSDNTGYELNFVFAF